MARGLQKIQSQQKANEKNAKSKGNTSQKGTAAAGLLVQCVVCKVLRLNIHMNQIKQTQIFN